MASKKLFAGQSHPKFASALAEYLDVPPQALDSWKKTNDEFEIHMSGNVHADHLIVVQTCLPPTSDHLMELYLIVEKLRRRSPHAVITAVIPFMFYSHSIHAKSPEYCEGLRTIGKTLAALGVSQVITMDMHVPNVVPLFPVNMINVPALPLIAKYLLETKSADAVVVANKATETPDVIPYQNRLKIPMVVIDRRKRTDWELLSDSEDAVREKECIIIDDMIQTGETVFGAAKLLKARGAKKIRVAATHGVFLGEATLNLSTDFIDEIIVTNTLPNFDGPYPIVLDHKLHVIDVTRYIAQAIFRSINGENVSPLWEDPSCLQLIVSQAKQK